MRQIFEITPEVEARLNQLIVEQQYRRGDIITGNSVLLNSAFYISKGSARVFYHKKGKEKTFSFAFDDEFIIVPRHLLGQLNLPTIEFLEPTTVLTLNPRMIQRTAKEEKFNVDTHEALLFVNFALLNTISYQEERIIQFQQATARERYLWAIKRYPRLTEVTNGTQLASFLGLTRETLYRLRSTLPKNK